MLGSDCFSTSLDYEIFGNWSYSFEEAAEVSSFNKSDLSFLNYDASSNSSSIDGFSLTELENNFISDEFVSQVFDKLDDDYCFDVNTYKVGGLYEESNVYASNLTTSSLTIKETSSSVQSLSFKSWSRMTKEEQEESLLSISEITCRMGIREQLDIIHIMDPYIEISSDMKEFALDVSLLNDSKWKQIQDYFKKHTVTFPPSKISSNKSVSKSQKSKPYKASQKKAFSTDKTSKKHRQKKIKELSKTEELEKLKRKIEKQSRKEERSGLFVYEKVVKCSILEEDEDVNILE